MLKTLSIISCALAGTLVATELRVATYNVGAEFSGGSFIYGIGDPGINDHEFVIDVLDRIDADVVALQEIHFNDLSGNPDDLDSLAATLGYDHVFTDTASGAIDFNLRVVFLSRYPFLSTDTITSPPGAKEITRLLPVVRVDVPDTDADPWIISTHIKAGTGDDDKFRKAIELKRLAEYFGQQGILDDDPYVILGDFNPSGSSESFSLSDYNGFSSSLPGSFVLGNDVTFPVDYSTNIPSYFTTVSPVQLDPRQLDGSDATFQSGSTLDLILVSPSIAARPLASEVYDSVHDDSNVTGLPKAGLPLADSVSLDASDHYAVFADLTLAPPDPYMLTASGVPVTEDFEDFSGLREPVRWTSDGDAWLGADDGSSSVPGGRAFGTGSERAAGFVLGSSSRYLDAEFVNESSEILTLLDIDYRAEQWRSSLGGSADAISVELLAGGSATPLPSLAFTARTDLPSGPAAYFEDKMVRVGGLSVAPGESFNLRFNFSPGPGAGSPPSGAFINEIHYDNDGSDSGEFVEVVVGPGYVGALSDIELVLYNGNGGASYGSSHMLDSFALGTTTASGHRVFSKLISGIQNGSPDGMALLIDGVVSEFISYEGSFTATNGPADTLGSTNVGVIQNPNEPAGTNAIGLIGTGGASGDFTWDKILGLHSPGSPNAGQTFELPGLPPQGLGIDDLSVVFLTDSDGDGIPDSEDTDNDNDGQSDDYELGFGSDPLDPASTFEIELLPNGGSPSLSFPGAPGILYTIEWCDDLVSWQPLTTRLGVGGVILVPLPTDGERGFFRVMVGP